MKIIFCTDECSCVLFFLRRTCMQNSLKGCFGKLRACELLAKAKADNCNDVCDS